MLQLHIFIYPVALSFVRQMYFNHNNFSYLLILPYIFPHLLGTNQIPDDKQEPSNLKCKIKDEFLKQIKLEGQYVGRILGCPLRNPDNHSSEPSRAGLKNLLTLQLYGWSQVEIY